MDVEAKRQILYTALLRYSSETGSLRDRVIDRLVLLALIESSQAEPMQVSRIQYLTSLANQSSGLRTGLIQEALLRLKERNKVHHVLHGADRSYFLTTYGRNDIDKEAKTADEMFKPVLQRMLRDTSGLFDEQVGEVVCRNFVSECFARFGQQIAKVITGEITKDTLVDASDVEGAFTAAIRPLELSDEAVVSLRSRCIRFLKSTEPDDELLKFRLTQGYFAAQLLEFNNNGFNPIADDAFRDAVFYIDTNVLIGKLLTQEVSQLFDELVQLSRSLGIRLCVSHATIDEARMVASVRIGGLDRVLSTVPIELVNKTQDSFLDAFLELRNTNPLFTSDEFLSRFDEIPDFLTESGIEINDLTVEEIVEDRELSRECRIIAQAAERIRNRPKRPNACLHDAAHYVLVQEERQRGFKAWFLTQDKTLSYAAIELDRNQTPFCFPLVGFVQSVSPFIENPDAQHTLVDLFSAVLKGEVGDLSGDKLFDLSELRLISELHTDILETPPEQLIPAFDYVKKTILGGKTYQRNDHPKVALELKKFIISRADEKQQALQKEIIRLKSTADKEKRENKERLRVQNKLAMGRERRVSAFLALCGALMSLGLWNFDSEILFRFRQIYEFEDNLAIVLRLGLRIVGGGVLLLTFIPMICLLKPKIRNLILTLICVATLGAMDLVGSDQIAAIAVIIAVATAITTAVTVVLDWLNIIDSEESEGGRE